MPKFVPEPKIRMSDLTREGRITTTVHDGIAAVTFFHPAHNSLPGHLLSELEKAISAAGQNDSARVVVLQSEGDRTFCAGASFDELQAIRTFEEGRAFFMGFARVINAMRKCPRLIIGRVQGKTIGGGVGLAAATDYCIASQYATIKLSELAVGIGPFVVGPAVERKLGLSAFSQLAVNAGEWRTAEWAKTHGLFAEVFPTVEQTDAYVAHLAGTLAAYSPEAMREIKAILWQGCENWDVLLAERAAISGRLVLTPPARQAIEAFKTKT